MLQVQYNINYVGNGKILDIYAVVDDKQLCEIPNGLAFKAYARVLPMTEADSFTDVLVRQIYTARVADVSVNNHYLSVVSVVELVVRVAAKAGEGQSLYAVGA